VLQFNVHVQWVAEGGRGDINLVLLRETLTSSQQRENFALEFIGIALPPHPDYFTQSVASKWGIKPPSHEFDELVPCQCATVPLHQCAPLRVITGHVE
jgi:hypothetical protein